MNEQEIDFGVIIKKPLRQSPEAAAKTNSTSDIISRMLIRQNYVVQNIGEANVGLLHPSMVRMIAITRRTLSLHLTRNLERWATKY